MAQRPFADLCDQPGVFGNRDEFGGRNETVLRMVPAQQRFKPGDLLGRGLHHGLIIQLQLAMRQGIAQVFFQLAPFLGIAVQIGRIEMEPPAPGILGRIQRQIGIADQRFAGHPVIGCDRNPDRGADHHPAAIKVVRLRQAFDDMRGNLRQDRPFDASGQDDLEFVTPQPADPAGRTDPAFKPLCHLFEQLVAGGMPQRIVDLFEPVEIDQEHRAGALSHLRRDQDLFERLRHEKPVGQSGQRIEMGQARHMLLRAASLGQIGTGPAKPLEIVERVIDRPAGDRPPAFFVLDRGAHHQIAEA